MSVGSVFTIPPELPFLDALAAGLLARAGDNPLRLARMRVLLPTRRAVRALGEAFLRQSAGRALLLPRLVPVGDLDADALALGDEGAIDGALDVAPAVSDLRRRLMLTRLVLAWGKARGAGPDVPGQAAPLAAELARFLDEVEAEGLSFSALETLVPDEHAAHWQEVLKFLAILTEHWPAALEAIGCLDPAVRRNEVLAAEIAAWRRAAPADPVIAAGVTGGLPVVADLVAAVWQLPQGVVVLPGLARDADAETWSEIASDPAHPQHLLARLLARLDVEPAAVADWRAPGIAPGAPAARRTLVFEALRPAASSARWRELAPFAADSFAGLRRLDCAGPQEEALVIALVLRETLERPGATAALVTPDRDLARRVAAELRRWGIEIDDSAGVPLNRTPPGVFLRLLLEAAAQDLAPVPLLALLKHPLAAGGMAPKRFRALARQLEAAVLRGPRPAPGIAGLWAGLAEGREATTLAPLVAALDAALRPLLSLLAGDAVRLADLVATHVAAAEALARSDTAAGPARLWCEPAGETAARLISELMDAAFELPPLAGADYPALFEALIAGPVVRPAFGRHPRLFIWGLLEARLQHADLIVLGGLNEGTWPPAAESDPWLSRPMRERFGLPPPERRVGVAAHDFAQALGAQRVLLTRAMRVEGAPTVPSRWLLRLEAVLAAGGSAHALDGDPAPFAWSAALDAAARMPTAPPAPKPPVSARPRRLSVTEIETWRRDPYAIYARHVLGLAALEPLDADPGAADRGRLVHRALDDFVRNYPGALPPDALERLLELGREAFGAALERPGIRAFWWPRFERIAQWFTAAEAARRGAIEPLGTECRGRMILPGPAGAFELVAIADRIDRTADGLAIIDYKTGGIPTRNDVALGYAPQLTLEAAIAEAGGFAGVAAASVATLAFWELSGRDPPGAIHAVAADGDELRRRIDEAVEGLIRLIAKFDDPATPYLSEPRPDQAPTYSDYRHLARIREWRDGAGGGG